MFPIPGSRGYLTGFGTVAADSVTATGDIQGAVVRGTTALEFPATGVGVRCTTDTDTGIGQNGANTLSLYAGNFNWLNVLVGSVQTANSATFSATGAVINSGIVTPTTLAANTDNYAPTGYSTATTLLLSASLAVDLTGIVAVSGLTLWLVNIGANTITIKHDVTSTAANRFYAPGAVDFALTQFKAVQARYIAAQSRWVLGGAG